MQPLLRGFDPRFEPVALPALRPHQRHPWQPSRLICSTWRCSVVTIAHLSMTCGWGRSAAGPMPLPDIETNVSTFYIAFDNPALAAAKS
jgi:hypothetical protein